MHSPLEQSTAPQTGEDKRRWSPYRFVIIVVVMMLVNWWVVSSQGQTIDRQTDRPMLSAKTSGGRTTTTGVAWQTDYQRALERANRNRVPLLIYFYGDESWCQWCRKLETEVFATEAFANWAEGRTILLKIRYPDAPQARDIRTVRTMRIIRRYKAWITGYPTVLVVSPEEDVLGKVGYVPGGVNAWIKEAQPLVGHRDKVARLD